MLFDVKEGEGGKLIVFVDVNGEKKDFVSE